MVKGPLTEDPCWISAPTRGGLQSPVTPASGGQLPLEVWYTYTHLGVHAYIHDFKEIDLWGGRKTGRRAFIAVGSPFPHQLGSC